ncbi:MAG: hypothetical protein D6736_13790 [Nitrospinota bacterium]|nr:MAG: hypothetical protein D6736_13790 [Nitrospinota bacterium]
MVSPLQREILEYLEANYPHRVRLQYLVEALGLDEETLVTELHALQAEKLVELTRYKAEGTQEIRIHSVKLSERGWILLSELRESEYESEPHGG